MSGSDVCDDENRFALVRERIMARRNWEKMTSETREMAEMEDWELDELERLLTSTPLTTTKTSILDQIRILMVMAKTYIIGAVCAAMTCMFIIKIPENMYLHRSCLILSVVAATSLGGPRAGFATSAVSATFMATFLSATECGRLIWIAMVFAVPPIVSSYPRNR